MVFKNIIFGITKLKTMAPPNTTSISTLLQALVDDLQLQASAKIEKRFSILEKRLENLEKLLMPETQTQAATKHCYLCDEDVLARGLCSKHYQKWRYRQRKKEKEIDEETFISSIHLNQPQTTENTRLDN